MAINVEISKITGINQVGNSYQRKSAVPLDYYSLFNTKAEAEAYAASNPVSYVGQVISYIDEGAVKVCVIENTEGLLKEVGTAPIGDESTIVVAENGTISLAGVEDLVFSEEVTNEDGSTITVEHTYQALLTKNGLTWIEPSKTTVEGLATLIEGLDKRVDSIETSLGIQGDSLEEKQTVWAHISDHDGRLNALETQEIPTYSVASGDKILQLNGTEFSADLQLVYRPATETSNAIIQLLGSEHEISLPEGGTDVVREVVSEIDASAFVTDGFLKNVEYDADTNELVFEWNNIIDTDEDKNPVYQTVRVNVGDLVDTYTEGALIDISNNVISHEAVDAPTESNGSGRKYLTGITTDGYGHITGYTTASESVEDTNTTYTLSKNGVTVTLTPSEGEAQSVTLDAYTKSETDNKIDEKIASVTGGESAADVKLALESYRDALNTEIWGEEAKAWTVTTEEDGKTKVTYTPQYGNESRLDRLEKVGAQANIIEAVKVNGTTLPVTDKAVDITVPTKVSDLTNDAGYVTNVRVKDKVTDGEGTTTYESLLKINPSTDSSTVLVVDDSSIQALIKQVKDTSDTAVQTAKFAGTAFTKTGTELSISQADARTALGLGSAAYKDESAFAPAGNYKTLQNATAAEFVNAEVIKSWSQNANGEVSITTRNLTPADIGAQVAGNYKTEQTAVEDPTATAYTGSTLSYIETLSQDKNGVISATKRSFDIATYVANAIGNMTNIMNFRGVVTPTDAGFNSDIASITSPANGDVVLYGEYEYIYDGTAWKVFGDATGTLATAKQYTDDSIAALLVKNVDNKTLQLDENGVASIKTVSTDLLEQGEKELILFAGNSTGYTTNA